jgi:hypothetical protein
MMQSLGKKGKTKPHIWESFWLWCCGWSPRNQKYCRKKLGKGMQHKMSYLRKVVDCGLSPKNQNLQELWLQRVWERQNVKFENGGSCSLRPKSKPKNHESNNDAKLGKRNCSNYSEKVVV